MSDSTRAVIQRAYELIENDSLEEAQSLLTPLLDSDARNPSLWWVYAHALRDPDAGRAALDRALELDPTYPGARELKADVEASLLRAAEVISLSASEPVDDQPALDDSIDDWEDLPPVVDNPEPERTSRALIALALVLIIAVGVAAFVASGAVDISELLSGLLPTSAPAATVVVEPTPAATAVASTPVEETPAPATATAEATDESAATATPSETESPPTATANPTTAPPAIIITPAAADTIIIDLIDDLAASLADIPVDPSSSGFVESSLGTTLVLHVCAVPGPELNERLRAVMEAYAQHAPDIPDTVDAAAGGLLNCDDAEARLRVIGATVELVREYAAGEIDQKEFQRAWQPLS